MHLFLDEHRKFLILLLKHEVKFMLIGGYAVIIYGYERGTGDMDLWLQPDNDNKRKFIEALKEHGISQESLDAVSKMDFTTVIALHLGDKPNKIDFLTKVQGLDFEEADQQKRLIPLNDLSIPVIDYDHLIRIKLLAGRPQDKADVDILQKINRFRK